MLSDFYKVGLRGYCEGKFENSREFVTSCSPQKNFFWFNFQTIWGLNDTVPDDIKKAMESYQTMTKWMSVCFGLALATTVLEILFSFTALFTRWGSFATTIISSVRPPPKKNPPQENTNTQNSSPQHSPSQPL